MLLLDTNVVSELRKVRVGKADTNVARWARSLDAATLFISAITLHELELGVPLAERRDPSQGAALRLWLDARVMPAFEGGSYRSTRSWAGGPPAFTSPTHTRSTTH